jgi:hypothetical protein
LQVAGYRLQVAGCKSKPRAVQIGWHIVNLALISLNLDTPKDLTINEVVAHMMPILVNNKDVFAA